jgi:hypothetical protein
MTRRVQRRAQHGGGFKDFIKVLSPIGSFIAKTVKRKRKQKGGGFKDIIKVVAPYGPAIAKSAVKQIASKKKKKKVRRRRPVYE